MTSVLAAVSSRVLRHSTWDALFVALSVVHGALLLLVPSLLLVGIGLWWNANTVAHNFIHRPFFRSPAANRAYSRYLSLVLGFPQTVWRERHLAHHADRPARIALGHDALVELALVVGLWLAIAWVSPRGFLMVYMPGWLLGLGLCQLHGYYEHARGTTSHYGRVYNFLFFNDGYHVEHHARPGAGWRDLAGTPDRDVSPSRWPPVLRWMEGLSLIWLERIVLRSSTLQGWVVRVHERAFRKLLAQVPALHHVTVIGGGLFPRSAIVLRRIAPDAQIEILERERRHVDVAAAFVDAGTSLVHRAYEPDERTDADLLVLPLGYDGDRRRIYERPPAPAVLVHDWAWSRHGDGVIISWLLLKRLNLVGPLCGPLRESCSRWPHDGPGAPRVRLARTERGFRAPASERVGGSAGAKPPGSG
jgi:hypothetical protein